MSSDNKLKEIDDINHICRYYNVTNITIYVTC